jgi:hypothetical protein
VTNPQWGPFRPGATLSFWRRLWPAALGPGDLYLRYKPLRSLLIVLCVSFSALAIRCDNIDDTELRDQGGDSEQMGCENIRV